MRRRYKCKNTKRYQKLIFFAVGLLVACFFPPKFLVVFLAATVIVLGIIGR